MNAENRKYITRLSPQLSKVKLLIMITLLESGAQFPRDWVESSKLLYLTNVKHFDRYVRGLRDELGCDIEGKEINGELCYRVRSFELVKPKSKPQPKSSLADAQKEALLLYANHACQVCGAKLVEGKRGLQADLKIPAARGGSEEFNNWQMTCNICNVAKRCSCNQCAEKCAECPWAFPERAEGLTLIKLPAELSQKLANIGVTRQSDLEKIIIKSLQKSLFDE